MSTFVLLQCLFPSHCVSDVETRKRENIWKKNWLVPQKCCFQNKSSSSWVFDFKRTHYTMPFWFLLNVCAWTIAMQRALLCEMNMPERLFKVPLMAPGAIRLNRIPDMSLRSSISEIMPGAYLCDWLNEELQHAAALCLSLWWHFILMSWLTRSILKSESLSYERDLFEEKKSRMGDIMNV